MTDIERPWTAEEVAEAARVSVWTVGKWTRTGILPRLPGRAIRIPGPAVRRFQAYREVEDAGRAERIEAARVAMAACPMAPRHRVGVCGGCGNELPRSRSRWCSDECSDRWWGDHAWSIARDLAIDLAGREDAPCARCGRIVGYGGEVNHIVPRNGAGYGRGCHHHQSNLEVLCHGCHVVESTRQMRERRFTR